MIANKNLGDKFILVLLGNFMDSSGKLNNESKIRADKAAKIFLNKKEYLLIITSGWAYRKDTPITVADSQRKYLEKNHYIPQNKIYCQRISRDTVGDAIFSFLYIKEFFPSTKITVITSDYHIERTKKIFEFVYGKQYQIKILGVKTNSDIKNIKKIREEESLKAFVQTFKNIKAGDLNNIIETLSKKHPYYNGEKYPKLIIDKHN